MQHHTHLTRPPLMRSTHTNNIQIHPAPVPPTQMSQKLPQATNAAPTSVSMREHQNRLNKPPMATALHNQTTQMQKIRQQHQHLNYKNNNTNLHNNNNNTNNNNSFQQYNHINAQQQQQPEPQTHMGVLQQQQSQHQTSHRNVPPMHLQQKSQIQQQPPNVLQMKNHLSHQQQLQQINNSSVPKQSNPNQQQQQYSTYGFTGNKSKYGSNGNVSNNNTNNSLNATTTATNYSTPKSILQNPNRLISKTLGQTTTTISSATIIPVTLPATITRDTVPVDVISTVKSVGEGSKICNSIENSTQKGLEVGETSTAESLKHAAEGDLSIDGDKENKSIETQVLTSASESSANQLQNSILSNVDSTVAKHAKEKTPMCLVNELARFNKITHQYRLTGEKGPAHCKRFTVTLKLGDEEYTAEGFKIKKAQHLAAAQAIEKTAYKHPIPKGNRNNEDGKSRPYIMPTVELNALAMKLGQQTYYLLDPRQNPSPMSSATSPDIGDLMHEAGGIPTHHYGGPRPPMPHPASVHGHGGHIMPPPPSHSRMMHDAPYGTRRSYDIHGGIYPPPPPPPPPPHMQHQNQRSYLSHRGFPPMSRYHPRYPLLPPPPPSHGMPPPPHHMHPPYGVPTTPYKITLIVGKQKFIGVGRTMQQAKHDAAARALQVLKSKNEEKSDDEMDESMDENDAKSPISLVHEAAIKRSLQVHFKILKEEGPAHMRNFITACIVGSIVTEGQGHGKKISKKRAAEKMLAELEKLPPLTPIKSPIKRMKAKAAAKINLSPNGKINAAVSVVGKRGKCDSLSIKSKDIEKVEEDDENPITKLIQIQQNRKEKEPIFEFISKNGNDRLRRREFIVEVTAQGLAARGTGKNKKLAKRNAAENLLKSIAEAAQAKADETTKQNSNENTTHAVSTPQTTDKPKENLEEKSVNAPNEKPCTKMNLVNTSDVPIVSTTAGQVPGILILRQNKKGAAKRKDVTAAKPIDIEVRKTEADVATATTSDVDTTAAAVSVTTTTLTTPQEPVETAAISTPVSATADSNVTATTTTASITTVTSNAAVSSGNNNSNNGSNSNSSNNSSATPMMKHQLLYLAKLLGFEVNFSDYPKGNHNEFLTIVTLSTDPPQICHGFGTSTNESQNDAARNALKILSDLGLNNAKSN